MKRTNYSKNALSPSGRIEARNKTVGRPRTFDPSLVERAYKLTLLGLRDEDLATAFGKDVSTIRRWKNEHPAFGEAIRKGKEEADGHVAESLYHRAMGHTVCLREQKMNKQGDIVTLEKEQYIPADTVAAIFWLKNRHPEKWHDVNKTEFSGPGGGPIKHAVGMVSFSKVDLSDFTDDELRMVERLGAKIQSKEENE